MADSDVDICNLALFRVGISAQIGDLTEDSKAAGICALEYPECRDELLAAHPWSFAKARATLAALDESRTGWAFTYALPADYLQAIELLIQGSTGGLPIWPWPWPYAPLPMNSRTPLPSQKPPFAIESAADLGGKALLTDASPAELLYIAKLTSPAVFDPLFTKALVWRLAESLVMPMSVKPELVNVAHKAYESAFLEAVRADMKSSGDEVEPASSFEQAR